MTTDTAALREVVSVPDFRALLRVRLVGQFSDGLFQAALFSAVFFNPERATSAAQAAGLESRAIAETVRDTWAWMTETGLERAVGTSTGRGIDPEKEREVLAAWREQAST